MSSGSGLSFIINPFVYLATLGQVDLGKLLFPTINQNVSGPRLDDLSVQSSTYGKSIPLIYGPENRLAGNLIWSTGLRETVRKKKSGGKGGGGSQTQTTYTYRASFAIALSGRAAKRVNRIWCNSKLLFDANKINYDWDAGSPDLDDFGYDFIATSLGTTDAYIITKQPSFTIKIPIGTVPFPTARRQYRAKGTAFKSIRFYPGRYDQTVDSVIEAFEGAGNVPAYRGTCYMVFEDLQLKDYGNQIPQVTVELIADDSITAGDVVRDICQRGGLDDVVAPFLVDNVRGYAIAKDGSCADALVPLTQAYDFNLVEQNGNLRAVKRATTIHATIPAEDMGAQTSGSSAVDDVKFMRESETKLPRIVTVSYPDPEFDYQTSTQQVQRLERDSQNVINVEVPVVISAQEAKRIADKILWSAWAEAQSVTFSVTDKWARLTTGQVVAIPVAGFYQPMRVLEITRGDNGVSEVRAAKEDSVAFTTSETAADVTTSNPLRAYGDTDIILIDTTMLQAADDNNGFYWAATSPDLWKGGNIYRSLDGTTFDSIAPVGVRAGIGLVETALPAGPTNVWDYVNTIRVEMRYANETLDSVTELEVLNGANVAWLGNMDGNDGEIIQFMTPTLVSQGVYDLTGLLRGRLGTDHAIGTHGANEIFVLLDSAVGQSDFGTGDWDVTREYKGVSVDQDPDDVEPQDFLNTGERKRPRSGVNPYGVRLSGDLTIHWTPRTRIPYTGLAFGVPLGETTEAYEIDIMDGADVVRTISTTTPSASYTSAEQTTDFGSPQASVVCNIYQMSETRGRGRVLEATV